MIGVFGLVAVAAVARAGGAQTEPALIAPPESLHDQVQAKVRAEMDSQRLVGLSVGVIRSGELEFTQSFGFEDVENQIVSSDQTMYRWASISKPLTAIVAMKLADAGHLDLDADVRTYVPEFPDKGVTITTRQLLCHQGGIVHYTNGPVIATERDYDSEHPYQDVILALDTFRESPLVNEPGEAFSYSTRGYILLGAVAERAGGKPFAQLVDEMIADRAGMDSLRPDYQWIEIPHSAVGYRLRGRGENAGSLPSTDTDVSWKLAGGGFISTIGDLGRFAAALLGEELLTEELKDEMWTRQRTRDATPTRYGLGFVTNGENGEHLRVSHSGSQEKTKTYLLIAPHFEVGVVLMCNSEQARLGQLAGELLEVLIQDAKPADDGVAEEAAPRLGYGGVPGRLTPDSGQVLAEAGLNCTRPWIRAHLVVQ